MKNFSTKFFRSMEFAPLSKTILVCGFLLFVMQSNNLSAQRLLPAFSRHVIDDNLNLAKKIDVIDLDLDGDLDIVAVASNTSDTEPNVKWYENDGLNNFIAHVIADTFYTARSCLLADLNNDSYPDVLVGGEGRRPLMVYINDGSPADGGWIADSIGTRDSTIYSIATADFDSDGLLDIVATYANNANDDGGDAVRWFKNNGNFNFSSNLLISNYETAVAACIDDYNGDGYLDIATAAFGGLYPFPASVGIEDDISWWSNQGNQNFVRNSLNIPANFQSPMSIFSADINSDGYPDILASAFFGGFISSDNSGSLGWWQNDGNGNFGPVNVLISDFTHARSILAADIDGDSDTDILGVADIDNTIMWFENDGSQNFSNHVITDNFTYAYASMPVDIDGDGDVDIIGSAQEASDISWWENLQDDDRLVAANNPDTVHFWGDKVIIDFDSGTEDSVTVFYNAGTTPQQNALGMGIDHIAQRGFYTITTRKTDYTASVDFYYGSDFVDEWSAINTPGDLVICLWNDASSSWELAGTSQNVDESNQKIIVTGITSEFHPFSKWTLGSISPDNSLPVQLYAFNYQIVDNSVNLEWKTASEIENAGFELWRASKSDSQFVLLSDYKSNDALRGLGNSNTGKSYAYRDNSVILGNTYYYKLVDVDFNNRITEHEVLEVTVTGFEDPEILATKIGLGQNYPNPFNMSTTIPVSFGSRGTGGATLVIYNLLGQEIRRFEFDNPSPGINKIQWNGLDQFGKAVASGTYVYRLMYDGLTMTKKLLLLK